MGFYEGFCEELEKKAAKPITSNIDKWKMNKPIKKYIRGLDGIY